MHIFDMIGIIIVIISIDVYIDAYIVCCTKLTLLFYLYRVSFYYGIKCYSQNAEFGPFTLAQSTGSARIAPDKRAINQNSSKQKTTIQELPKTSHLFVK